MLLPLESMMWTSGPPPPPPPPVVNTVGGGGYGKNSKPVSTKFMPSYNWPSSQWYHTSVKIPILLPADPFEHNIKAGVMGWYNKVQNINIPINIEQDSVELVNQGVKFIDDVLLKSKTSTTFTDKEEDKIYMGVKYEEYSKLRDRHSVNFVDDSDNKVYSPVIFKEEIDQKALGKVRNLKLLDLLDLL